MGLKNSGPTFQRMLEAVLQGLEGLFIYLDDVLVWAKDERQHQKRVDALLKRLHENGLAIARDKCQFSKSALTFLGYTVSAQGIVPLQRKVETITAFPPPQKAKSLLGFLGAINYYRRCLPNLGRQTAAEVLQPLYTAATQKQPGKLFRNIWEEEGLDTYFKKAKELLVKACQLTHPDPNAPLALVADASGKAAGAALEQLTGGVWRPLGFWSRQFKDNQMGWTTFRRETYAVQQALRHFHAEISGRHLVIFSDHKPFVQAFAYERPPQHDQIAYNQLMEIAQWTSDVRHLPGKLNWVADSLSRPENVPLGIAHTLQTNLDALDVTGDGAPEVEDGRTEDVWTANVIPADGATELEVTGGFQTAEGWPPADGATGNQQPADVWTADVTPVDG